MEKEEIANLSDILQQATQEIQKAQSSTAKNSIIEKLVTSCLDAEFCSLWVYYPKKLQLIRNRDSNTTNTLALEEKKGILYRCFMTKESKIYNYLASDKDYVASIDNPDNIKIKSKIILPLLKNNELVGIVTAYNSIKKLKKFNKNDMEKLKALSPFLCDVIDSIKEQAPANPSSAKPLADKQNKETKPDDEILTFVANFVHDIRTPSNALFGFLDLLEEQIKDERLKSYLVNAKESATFINELTTSVLNMISTHKESVVSDVKEVESLSFFSAIAKAFSSNMYNKEITYNIYIDPLLPQTIHVDTLKLKRVVLNLIGNAYKFTPVGKTIEFSVRYSKKTNKLALYVKDSGIGIPKEQQGKIFEAFKQAEETTALSYGGTGLGLFISAKYVQELGGKLALVSEVDKGSTFSFEIPLKSNPEKSSYEAIETNATVAIVMDSSNRFSANNIARYLVRLGINKESIHPCGLLEELPDNTTHVLVYEHKLTPQNIAYAKAHNIALLAIEENFLQFENKEVEFIAQYDFYANKLQQFISSNQAPRVLVVDDDAISTMLIENILENEFCETEIAKDGLEALNKVIDAYEQNKPYTVLYIDNNMPKMNGTEVVQNIREFEQQNNLKPIFIVSTSGEQVEKEYASLFDVYLGKPFKKEQIKKQLRSNRG